MAHNSTYQSKTISRWGIVWLVVLFACMPICANAYYVGDYYNEDEYYDEYYYEEGYCSYESNVQDAFSSAAPGSRRRRRGRSGSPRRRMCRESRGGAPHARAYART